MGIHDIRLYIKDTYIVQSLKRMYACKECVINISVINMMKDRFHAACKFWRLKCSRYILCLNIFNRLDVC